MTSALGALLVVAAMGATPPADPCAQFDQARELLKAGKPGEARPIFLQCLGKLRHNEETRWRALLGAALSNELMGEIRWAVSYYRAFLIASRSATGSDWLTRRAQAAREVERLEPTVLKSYGVVRVSSSPSGAVLRVDDGSPDLSGRTDARTPFVFYAKPGRRVLELLRDGYANATRPVDVAIGQRYDLAVELTKLPQPPDPPDPTALIRPPVRESNPGPWVLVALGAGSAIAGGVMLGVMMDKVDQYKALVPYSASEPERGRALALADEIHVFNPTSVTLLAVGTGLLLGGILWEVLADEPAKVPTVSIGGDPKHGVLGVVSGRF